jgi:dihydrofolate synthase/folylpolyglutamate synthase
MNYIEAISYIENTGKFGINLGMQRIERLCELLGNPEKELKVVHVAGTNGKGSTTTFISSILMSQGYRVGIYTSPYIERFTERIKINENEIKEEELAGLVTEIKSDIDRIVEEGLEHPTEFEIITACAFKYFKDQQVDFVVLEVGLGGRFDATNVVDPVLSVITTISYDHINILGDTLGKIAFEKAGIIKKDRPVVMYPQEKEAMDVLMKQAHDMNSKIYMVGDMKHEVVEDTVDGIVFNAAGEGEYNNLKINLLGMHQVFNALTALKSIEVLRSEGFKVEDSAIYSGLAAARWPGRFEIISRHPYIVLDGGHNMQGIESIAASVKKYFEGRKIRIITGMLKDKDYSAMASKLGSICDYFITVEPNSPRALTADEMRQVFESLGKEAYAAGSIREGAELALDAVKEDEVALFCGSLYMIGEVRSILKEKLGKTSF